MHTGVEIAFHKTAAEADQARSSKKVNGFPGERDKVSVLMSPSHQACAMLLDDNCSSFGVPLRDAVIACGGMLCVMDLGHHETLNKDNLTPEAMLKTSESLCVGSLIYGDKNEQAQPMQGCVVAIHPSSCNGFVLVGAQQQGCHPGTGAAMVDIQWKVNIQIAQTCVHPRVVTCLRWRRGTRHSAGRSQA
jgi:hypothetical protein